jgi:hypothetical protein
VPTIGKSSSLKTGVTVANITAKTAAPRTMVLSTMPLLGSVQAQKAK